MNKEVAKELLRKGILLGDPELVAMANQLLGEPEEEKLIITDASEKPKKTRGRPKKTAKAIDKEEESFIIKKKTNDKEVFWSGNTWKDTGENGDLDKKELKTPKIKLEPRRPPYRKVSHKCSRCNAPVKIYPHDKTEFYKCEDCIKDIVRR